MANAATVGESERRSSKGGKKKYEEENVEKHTGLRVDSGNGTWGSAIMGSDDGSEGR